MKKLVCRFGVTDLTGAVEVSGHVGEEQVYEGCAPESLVDPCHQLESAYGLSFME